MQYEDEKRDSRLTNNREKILKSTQPCDTGCRIIFPPMPAKSIVQQNSTKFMIQLCLKTAFFRNSLKMRVRAYLEIPSF